MGRPKKDARYLNVYIKRSIHEALELFCEEYGQSKTVATERALQLYMEEMRAKMSNKNINEDENEKG